MKINSSNYQAVGKNLQSAVSVHRSMLERGAVHRKPAVCNFWNVFLFLFSKFHILSSRSIYREPSIVLQLKKYKYLSYKVDKIRSKCNCECYTVPEFVYGAVLDTSYSGSLLPQSREPGRETAPSETWWRSLQELNVLKSELKRPYIHLSSLWKLHFCLRLKCSEKELTVHKIRINALIYQQCKITEYNCFFLVENKNTLCQQLCILHEDSISLEVLKVKRAVINLWLMSW